MVMLTLVVHRPAAAGCSWLSVADPRLVVCPAGDIPFRILAIKGPFPVPNDLTSIQVDACPAVHLAPFVGGEDYALVDGIPGVTRNTDADGVADYHLRAGGVCSTPIYVWVDCYVLVRQGVASPDQDGDLLVGADDLAAIESKLGSSDLTGDLDGDGAVTAADVAFARLHLGHAAERPTAALPAWSWGRLKAEYR